MAAEAVYKIKEAEDQGNESIRIANEEAKQIIKQAEVDAVQKRKSIFEEAKALKTKMLEAAEKKALEDCSDLIEQGKQEKMRILNPDESRLEEAVALAMERIVNQNGDS